MGFRELNMRIVADPDLNRILWAGHLDPDALSPQELTRYNAVCGELFAHFQECRMVHDLGIMDDDYYEAWKRVFRVYLQFPGMQRYWEQGKSFFPEATVQAVDALGDPDPSLVDAGAAAVGIPIDDLRGAAPRDQL